MHAGKRRNASRECFLEVVRVGREARGLRGDSLYDGKRIFNSMVQFTSEKALTLLACSALSVVAHRQYGADAAFVR